MQRGKTGLIKNCGITAGILGLATAVCFFLQNFATTDTHVPLLFVLAVLFVSKYTDGYGYGIVASLIAVVGVNFVFTYPYFALNFTITGYPLTFLVMLVVAVTASRWARRASGAQSGKRCGAICSGRFPMISARP